MISRLLLFVTFVVGAWACEPDAPDELPDFRGRSLAEVVSELGTPDEQTAFLVTDTTSLYEYQSGLYRHVSDDMPVEVQELTWKRPSRTLAVWFRRQGDTWVGLEGLRWDDDIVF